MSIALKEARETEYWFEILVGNAIAAENQLGDIRTELDEIISLLRLLKNGDILDNNRKI